MLFSLESRRRRGLLWSVVAVASFQWMGVVAVRGEGGARGWKAPARAAHFRNPVSADSKSLAAGKALYARECVSCHGEGGRGNGPDAADLSRQPADFTSPAVAGQADGELFWKLTEGNKPMPRYGRMLSEDDRWNLVNYIRSIEGVGHS
jgi:mono/diheme cytochrome c family protein